METGDEVLDTFHRFRDALLSCDVEALDQLLASDYRGYNLRGQLERRELILSVYQPGGVLLDRFDADELHVDVFGEVGIVTGRGLVRGSFQKEIFEHKLRFCDIYVRRDAGWQLFLSQATPLEDG